MPLFDIPNRVNNDKEILNKVKSPRKSTATRSNSILDKLELIRNTVDNVLGKYKDDYIVISNKEELKNYLKNTDNYEIAIDTETTGLDPISDKIVGLCLYREGFKAAYVPINHVSYITNERLDNQLTEEEVAECIKCLENDKWKIIMFNAKFDIRVMRNQLGIYLKCYWDCYLASRLLNENEEHKGLKALHQKYVLDDAEDEFSFEALFKGLTADKIPVSSFYLYAAHDALVTYELYKFQSEWIDLNSSREDMRDIAKVFFEIEMPCVEVCADMEDVGVALDVDYAKQLSIKYTSALNDITERFYRELDKYSSVIEKYRRTHENSSKLDNPINIASSTQIAILLYDILNVTPPDTKKPRGTGEDILQKIDLDICKIILEYRAVQKLLTTYIDKLPKVLNPKDNKIHCNFKQYGADTGRMSSEDPNLQNIPSHNKDIRKMFVASPGYVLLSSDYSQQEPKCLAALCRMQGDSQMYNTFMNGKDLYSEIASKAFNKPYEQCLEFNADGTTNKEGKERRTQAKSILLGVLYGRGVASIAEQLKCSVEKAQQIKDSVFKGFPAIERFERDSLRMGEELGYVTTVCGRKRRLPALQLNEYEFALTDNTYSSDVLDFEDYSNEVPEDRINYYLRKLSRVRFAEKRKVFEEANNEGIWIIDNGRKIADAQRQCVNARIQGSAADLTKLAMIELNSNERLKELGFRLLIPVHDEVIAECPEENVKEVKELLVKTMSHAAEEILEMPVKCDVDITKEWYGSVLDI